MAEEKDKYKLVFNTDHEKEATIRAMFSKLREPFVEEDIEWRIARSGFKQDETVWAQVLAYISARAAHQRLDDVVGPHNWEVKYNHINGGVMACIRIQIGGEWVEKWDGAENTQYEAFKGGISAAFKRAAAVWGIGRYLYGLKATFAKTYMEKEKGARLDKCVDKKSQKECWFWWKPPKLPPEALP
jgi:hypothetical protein